MPFTISHTAAILPFARTGLPPAALALGAMSPDIFYFVRIGVPREFSHSLSGVVTVDLAIGLLAFALWVVALRKPVLDYAPGWLRERLSPEVRWRSARGAIATSAGLIGGLAVGALTHLAWDLFTHDGSLDAVFPVLAGEVAGVEIDEIVHATSSVVGMVILALWVSLWVRRTPRVPRSELVAPNERRLVWLVEAALLVSTALIVWIAGIIEGYPPLHPHLGFRVIVLGILPASLVAAGLIVSWHARNRRAVAVS